MDKEIKIIPCRYEIKMMPGHMPGMPDDMPEDDMPEENKGVFCGYASLFDSEPDSYGDLIAKGAFAKSIVMGGRNRNGVAMLSQHDSSRPIGVWTMMKEDDIGLKVEGKLATKCCDGKDMYELMKIGAIKGLSIGYSVKKEMWDEENKIRTLMEVDLWEISPVTFPAKVGATVSDIKSIVETARNERDLENALRESGLSKQAAMYIVKQCKDKLRESVDSERRGNDLLKVLSEFNKNFL